MNEFENLKKFLKNNYEVPVKIISHISNKNEFYRSIKKYFKDYINIDAKINIYIFNLLTKLLNFFYWIHIKQNTNFFQKYANYNLKSANSDKNNNIIQLILENKNNEIIKLNFLIISNKLFENKIFQINKYKEYICELIKIQQKNDNVFIFIDENIESSVKMNMEEYNIKKIYITNYFRQYFYLKLISINDSLKLKNNFLYF